MNKRMCRATWAPWLCAFAITCGCASQPNNGSVAELKADAADKAFYSCRKDLLREAWRRNWDERSMWAMIEATCSRFSGRPPVGVPINTNSH
jgi:hypothetical protein